MTSALALSLEAGWNQIAADWRLFIELGGVIGLLRDGRLIATAATLPYAGGFAWISMVLVTAAERRQGLASWLLRCCVDDLLARELVPVLDATPAGRPVYIGLGFQDHWTLQRLIGRSVPMVAAGAGRAAMRPIEADDWPRLIAYDTAAFGADRGVLLQRLAPRLHDAALIAERDGKLAGYLLGRDGRVMNQLGPLVAEDDAVAIDLLARAIGTISSPIAIDLPDRHENLRAWLTSLGFAAERPLTRMGYGTKGAFDDAARLFAIAGPELG
ncbi:MAG: GNAT family N-acetyltransferase [Xanthobacteraceae bacterium]